MPSDEASLGTLGVSERTVMWFRLAATTLALAMVVFTTERATGNIPLALTVVGLAWAYNFGLLLWKPLARLAGFKTAAVITIFDASFLLVLIHATGGASSLFYLFYMPLVLSIALRYGTRETFFAASLYAVSYCSLLAARLELIPNAAEILARIGVMMLVAGFASLITRDATRQARERVKMRAILQQAQSEEARIRGLLEATPDAILIFDDDGQIVLVNSEAERVFGYDRSDLIGRPADLLVPDLSAIVAEHAGEPAGASAVECMGRRRDDSTFPAEARFGPVTSESSALVTATIRDLTERKRAEQERVTNVERLKELERLRELDEFKTQFINMAAHELGTPLTPIKLQIFLLKTSEESLSSRQRKAVDILDRNVDRLQELVKDVLDVARLQARKLGVKREALDLNRVVLEAVESFQEPARQEGIHLEARLTPDIRLQADANRLTQVLFNLLNNALKFTPSGGRITVESAKLNDMAIVRVVDSGLGLRPEDRARLFQPFSQVHDPMQKSQPGSGLGLYISKGIVELHGGRIWCESPGPGLGSTFAFALPLATPLSRTAYDRVGLKVGSEVAGVLGRARELI